MATILRANGSYADMQPKNGRDFSLEELQGVVNGYIEIVELANDQIMVVNEEGKVLGLPVNSAATQIYNDNYKYPDVIMGDVLICHNGEVL